MKRFYVAFDFSDFSEIQKWSDFIKPHDLGIKIGLEAYVNFGPPLVKKFVDEGFGVFLDLKLFDIPNTVVQTIEGIKRLKVDGFTLHGQCGDEVWRYLKSNVSTPKPFAVTALTSMNQADLQKLGFSDNVEGFVRHMAQRLKELGQKNFVCSVHERETLRNMLADQDSFHFLCPGVRIEKDQVQDQKRVATIDDLRDTQNTSFVIGRALTQAEDPADVLGKILEASRT